MRWLLSLLLLACVPSMAQLRSGFDPAEYASLLKLPQRDSLFGEPPPGFTFVHASKEAGFQNRWFLWKRNDGVAVIVIRGTVGSGESWLANFYAAMIPAKGTLRLNDSTTFDYRLAGRADAYVHVGWTVSLGHLAPDIVQQVREQYAKGVRSFIVFGHSQGGAIAFLLRSYLEYLPDMPKDITWKTYCSAAPKPGNMFYAYDFDHITRNGWGYRVVSAEDWVPETPLSLQTVKDFNAVNPFAGLPGSLKKKSSSCGCTAKWSTTKCRAPRTVPSAVHENTWATRSINYRRNFSRNCSSRIMCSATTT
ncbi:lipase family protein [Chitinophaga lutea]